MPKKTKKQKLVSQYRRKISEISRPEQDRSGTSEAAFTAPMTPRYSIPTAGTQAVRPTNAAVTLTERQHAEFSAIRQDLVRTLILVGAMFAAEIAIWRIWG